MTLTEDFQLELRDLVIGSNTAYGIVRDQCVNWWDLANIRPSDIQLPGRNGVLAGDDLYGGLTFSWTVDIIPTDSIDLASAIDALKAAFARSDADLPMYGQMLGQTRLRWVRPRRCVVDPRNVTFDWAAAQIQVMVVDPFSYSADEDSASTTLSVTDEGLVFPVTFPVEFGPVSGGAGMFNAHNDGNAPAPWTATLTGPLEDPVIENQTLGISFGMTGEVEAGDTLYLDSKARTILLNGTTNRSSMRAAGVRWFDLAPGDNSIRFTAGGEPPYGDLTMTWRSAWH